VTVIKQLRKHSRVEIVDDERELGNGIIVTLRKGWTFDPAQDKRGAAAATFREAWEMVRQAHPFAGPWQESLHRARYEPPADDLPWEDAYLIQQASAKLPLPR
jgi:hypothetical protein